MWTKCQITLSIWFPRYPAMCGPGLGLLLQHRMFFSREQEGLMWCCKVTHFYPLHSLSVMEQSGLGNGDGLLEISDVRWVYMLKGIHTHTDDCFSKCVVQLFLSFALDINLELLDLYVEPKEETVFWDSSSNFTDVKHPKHRLPLNQDLRTHMVRVMFLET